MQTIHYFSTFSKYLIKLCVNFWRVWTKNSNSWESLRKLWNSLMKFLWKNWIFYFFHNLLLKIELSEITPCFYYNLFGFGWGGRGISRLPSWLGPWLEKHYVSANRTLSASIRSGWYRPNQPRPHKVVRKVNLRHLIPRIHKLGFRTIFN